MGGRHARAGEQREREHGRREAGQARAGGLGGQPAARAAPRSSMVGPTGMLLTMGSDALRAAQISSDCLHRTHGCFRYQYLPPHKRPSIRGRKVGGTGECQPKWGFPHIQHRNDPPVPTSCSPSLRTHSRPPGRDRRVTGGRQPHVSRPLAAPHLQSMFMLFVGPDAVQPCRLLGPAGSGK